MHLMFLVLIFSHNRKVSNKIEAETTALNWQKLKQAESNFLIRYPQAFDDPELAKIGKKHKVPQMIEFAQSHFSKKQCRDVTATCDNMIKVISRSSMVSLFEKPKFRDFVRGLNYDEKAFLANALSERLHGKQQMGFEAMVEILKTGKLAKWSLISIIPTYFAPLKEVFIKPTTVKNILTFFEVPDLVYRPTPTWDFYRQYQKLFTEMKTKTDARLAPSNPAFSGFLMLTMGM